MSAIVISSIVGTGTYAVPTTDTEMLAAQSGLATLLGGIAGLTWQGIQCRIVTGAGVGATRTLACRLDRFAYGGQECLSAATTAALAAAVELALLADTDITAVGDIEIEYWEDELAFNWVRSNGVIRRVNSGDIVTPLGNVLAISGSIDLNSAGGILPGVSAVGRSWLYIEITGATVTTPPNPLMFAVGSSIAEAQALTQGDAHMQCVYSSWSAVQPWAFTLSGNRCNYYYPTNMSPGTPPEIAYVVRSYEAR